MINKERSVRRFCELVSIDSLSFKEDKMTGHLLNVLKTLDINAERDKAGNIYAYVKGGFEGGPILLCAHTDTVSPGIGKKAVVHTDGKITSAGDTVLGADDMAGIAAILEVLCVLRENGLKHRDIELLFPAAEEVYIKGTSAFDFSKMISKTGYVLDLDGEIGTAAVQAPSLISFEINVKGKTAHAGFAPENGINAIAAAAEAPHMIKQGRPDDVSTLNIGTIAGGTATNIVSESCVLKGELRSLDDKTAEKLFDELKQCFETACEKYGAGFEIKHEKPLTAYKTDINGKTAKLFEAACKAADIKPKFVSTFGGSDNNNLAKHGIEGIVVSVGYHNAHTAEEYIYTDDLDRKSVV